MKTNLTIVLLFVVCSIQAQNFKFGKVSEEELSEKYHPIDSSADAAFLYRYEKVSFDYNQGEGFQQVREIHERVKIYNKEGFKWATKRIELYNESTANDENLNKLKGYTYNLVDGKIEEEKLKKSGMFEEETNKYWKVESFTMPNIKEGSVIEYSYEVRSPFMVIDDINFQYTIPVNKYELAVRTPDFFIYNKLLNPKTNYIPKLNETKESKTLVFTNSSSTINSDFERKENHTVSAVRTSQSKQDYTLNILTSTCDNIPALKEEPFVDNLNNYRSKLALELTTIKYPNQQIRSLSSNWATVSKRIYDNDAFGGQLAKSGYFNKDIDALLQGVDNPIQKIAMIYNFIKSKVKWNGYYGYTAENGVRKAYKEGSGNVADINLMLVAMLRFAGIEANPVLVSTKNHGIPLFPTRSGFNYVICFVEGEEFGFKLDATDPNGYPNVLPTRALNWQGRILRSEGASQWVSLQPQNSSREVTSLNVKINPDFSVSGKVRNQKSHYIAKRFRDNYAGVNDSEYIKHLEEENPNLLVEDISIEDVNDLSQPVKVTYDYSIEGGVEEIGSNLYFSPMFFLAIEENPFKSESRNFPIDFSFPVSDKYMINIMLPDGYEVESLPENKGYDYNQGQGSFKYIIKQSGNFLQLNVDLDMKTSRILSDDYPFFKEFFSKVVEKESEQIVLKKI